MLYRSATYVTVAAGVAALLLLVGIHANDRLNWTSYYANVARFGGDCAIAVVPWEGSLQGAERAALTTRPFPMPHRTAVPPLRVDPQHVLVTRCPVSGSSLQHDGYLRVSLGVVYGPSLIYFNHRVVEEVNHHEEVTLPVVTSDIQPTNVITIVSRGTPDGLAGLATLVPPYIASNVLDAHLIDHFFHSWNSEQPALLIGATAVIMIFLMILWFNGFNYADVGWNLVQAASLCAAQGAIYGRQFFNSSQALLRLEGSANFVLAVATIMFVVSFLRPRHEVKLNQLASLVGIGLVGIVACLPSALFLNWHLLSETPSYLQGFGLILALLLMRRPNWQGVDPRRQSRRRLMTILGSGAAAISLVQAFLEMSYGLLITPLAQTGLALIFNGFLLQDLLVSQRLYFSEREARLAQENDAKTSKALAQMAQMASHDAKRPFRIIKVFEGLLRRVRTADEVAALLRVFVPQLTRAEAQVQGLIDDILERQDHSGPDVSSSASAIEPRRLLAQVIDVVALSLDGAPSPELRYELTDHRRWRGNGIKIMRVLQNLIENAARATPVGGSITMHSEQRDGATTCFSVHNTGSFINEAAQARLFTIGFSERGSGYGLAAAKRIVENHGGQIWCDSSKTGGTTFSFTVPVETQNDQQTPETQLPELPAYFPRFDLAEIIAKGALPTVSSLPRLAVVDDDPMVELAWRTIVNDVEFEFFRDPDLFLELQRSRGEKGEPFAAVILDYVYKGSLLTGPILAAGLANLTDFNSPLVVMSDKRIKTGEFSTEVLVLEDKTPLPWSKLVSQLKTGPRS